MQPNTEPNKVNIVARVLICLLKTTIFCSPFLWMVLSLPVDYPEPVESRLSLYQPKILSGINRAQQFYYLHHKTFSHEILAEYPPGEEDKYYYDYFLETTKDLALVYAIPKYEYYTKKFLGINLGENTNQPFYGYVSAIFMVRQDNQKNYEYKHDIIIGKNITLGSIKPNKPILKDNTWFCREGTRELK